MGLQAMKQRRPQGNTGAGGYANPLAGSFSGGGWGTVAAYKYLIESNLIEHARSSSPRAPPENKDGLMRSISETLFVPMNPVLKLLMEGGSATTAQMAKVSGLSESEVNQQLEQLKQDKIFLGWRPVLDLSREAAGAVRAVIEVKMTPERGGGFNRLAERLSKFDEVESCYLMSGSYDLLIFITGSSLQKVAGFVSEKLSTLEGVLSTSTHFMLRSYKEGGYLIDATVHETGRLKVTP
jgi:DNA-binding Lrp family transcriptional regulator